MGQREDVYDNEINPLMARIIELCKEHDIPVVAQFQINERNEGTEALYCTTAIVPEDGDARLKSLANLARNGFTAYAVRVRTRAAG